MHDLVIRNARIVDGTGGDSFAGDVAVDDGLITAVVRAEAGGISADATKVIDAEGKLLTPGFVHSHPL